MATTRTPVQLELPLGQAPDFEWCQRWHHGRHSWTHRSAGGFDPSLFSVEPLAVAQAKAFVRAHHYLKSLSAVRYCFGLYLQDGLDLVGVAAFGIPAHPAVLANPLPDLKPYAESLVLTRFCVLGEPLTPGAPGGRCPGNTESWFLARAHEQLTKVGIQATVAFSDPVPRQRPDGTLWPGHYGTIYQASNALYLGKTSRRPQILLPDGTVLDGRSASKIRNREVGCEGAERRLVALGASVPRGEGKAAARAWLTRALDEVRATRVEHSGMHKFVMPTSKAARREVRVVGALLPYPKAHDAVARLL